MTYLYVQKGRELPPGTMRQWGSHWFVKQPDGRWVRAAGSGQAHHGGPAYVNEGMIHQLVGVVPVSYTNTNAGKQGFTQFASFLNAFPSHVSRTFGNANLPVIGSVKDAHDALFMLCQQLARSPFNQLPATQRLIVELERRQAFGHLGMVDRLATALFMWIRDPENLKSTGFYDLVDRAMYSAPFDAEK